MFDAASDALSFAVGRQQADLDKDRQLLLSIVKSLEIIGEAASKVSVSTREAHEYIPWHASVFLPHPVQPNQTPFVCSKRLKIQLNPRPTW